MDQPLAGKSTLNRMELGTGTKNRYKKIAFRGEAIDELMVVQFIESYEKAPIEIILDVDTTDLPLHGKQEGRFFHGYYDNYCYLPLYVFCGEQVLCARLREATALERIARRDRHRLSTYQNAHAGTSQRNRIDCPDADDSR